MLIQLRYEILAPIQYLIVDLIHFIQNSVKIGEDSSGHLEIFEAHEALFTSKIFTSKKTFFQSESYQLEISLEESFKIQLRTVWEQHIDPHNLSVTDQSSSSRHSTSQTKDISFKFHSTVKEIECQIWTISRQLRHILSTRPVCEESVFTLFWSKIGRGINYGRSGINLISLLLDGRVIRT